MGDFVRLELHGAVGVIRLDRPPVNAINIQIHHELLDGGRSRWPRARAIRAVVLYGGERSFAAGADITELATCGPGEITAFGRTLNHAVTAIARLGQPVIAAVNGYALGAGCELALAADFRIVADDVRIGLPEITLGVIPGAGGTQRLPRLVGVTKAKELIFSGRAGRRAGGGPDRAGDQVAAVRGGAAGGDGAGQQPGSRTDGGAGRRQAGDRRRDGRHHLRRARPGGAAVRGTVRDRRPDDRHDVVPAGRTGKGHVHRQVTVPPWPTPSPSTTSGS